jgi:hypothetical protein
MDLNAQWRLHRHRPAWLPTYNDDGVPGQPHQFAICVSEVRGSDWIVWAGGAPDAFESKHPCDGVVVRDGSGAQVWLLAVGQPLHPNLTTLCPCDPQFRNSSVNWANRDVAGAHWTCDRVTQTGGEWTRLFDRGSNFACTKPT